MLENKFKLLPQDSALKPCASGSETKTFWVDGVTVSMEWKEVQLPDGVESKNCIIQVLSGDPAKALAADPESFLFSSEPYGTGYSKFTGGVIPGAGKIGPDTLVLFTPSMGPYAGRTSETITDPDWTPEQWTVRDGAVVTIKVPEGAGHVDLTNLIPQNENITLELSGELNQLTAGSNTKLKAAPGQQQIFDLSRGMA